MYADVFGVLKIYVSEALARYARSRSTYFCRYIWGVFPPPQYQNAGYATDWNLFQMIQKCAIFNMSPIHSAFYHGQRS